MERALKKDLERMSETGHQALLTDYPEEAEEMVIVEDIQKRHWLSQGISQFALEMLEVVGAVAAFIALPVAVSLIKDGQFSSNENITIWQLALGLIGTAIYVGLRYWLKGFFEKKRNA